MSKLLTLSLSALALVVGVTSTLAYEAGPGMMQGGPQGQSSNQAGQPGWGMPAGMPWAHGHMQQGWTGRQAWGPAMMGFGMMGGGMMSPAMMIVMMDTNNDGSISLDEFQAMHARMFRYLDTNHDGQLSQDELRAFGTDGDDGQPGK